jgi:probable HAF family extracellular repeat protein
VTDLGGLYIFGSVAEYINNKGQIVGYSVTSDMHYHAFLWQNGTMIDLGTLGGWDSKAYAINDNGWIVGWAATGDSEHAVLWTPVPEPPSILALLCGMGGIGVVFRRNRKGSSS